MSESAVLERESSVAGTGNTSDVAAITEDAARAAKAEQVQARRVWAASGLGARLKVIRKTREALATRSNALADAISHELSRTRAETVAAEVLPLLAACRYLEREAAAILQTRRPGRRGLPLWLSGLRSDVERVPVGTVLVIGPANYPLLLPGVQAMQALAAGNAVVWKPGRGGRAVAVLVEIALREAGLPPHVLTVTDESVDAAQTTIADGVDLVVFTGSAANGRRVLRLAAETLTPVIAELSGSDAVVVLPSADLALVAEALAFGMRLNGSATCMAPRRVLLVDATAERRAELLDRLRSLLATIPPVSLPEAKYVELRELVTKAVTEGATLLDLFGDGALDEVLPRHPSAVRPIVLLAVTPEMRVARTDLFAPVLAIIEVDGEHGVLEAQERCPLALTAAIFCGTTRGEERRARRLAARLEVGTVLINDVIVATADPRVPFTARRGSGFGSTRGAEGLLAMTVPRVVSVQRGRSRRRLQPTGAAHVGLLAGLAALLYAGTMTARWGGLRQMTAAAREIDKQEKIDRQR